MKGIINTDNGMVTVNMKEGRVMKGIINTDSRMVTANMKEERLMKGKMENIMKTGIITVSTAAAAGLVFGMSPVTAHAAETDTNVSNDALQAPSEMSAPGPVSVVEAIRLAFFSSEGLLGAIRPKP